MKRKTFLKSLGLAAAAAAAPKTAVKASTAKKPKKEFYGVLTDTTRCIGCRACEKGCAIAHKLPIPDTTASVVENKIRDTSENQRTVVNGFETSKGKVYVKRQCMHCWQPACASACLTNAMEKTPEGPTVWRSSKCMGCRFCMVSCPFNIPKAEYNSWNPKIEKCDMCWERVEAGGKPACVSSCPTDALMFGPKRELMEIARTRIYKHPEKYVHHIYGEHEVGGTGWLYLSAVPFTEIGFRDDLGTLPYPEYTKQFLYAVPAVLLVVPPLLYGLQQLGKKINENNMDSNEED